MDLEAVNPARRLKPEWVEGCLRDLTADELRLIRNALGELPLEPSWKAVDEYWKKALAGEMGVWYCRDYDEQIAVVTFYALETYRDGALNFLSCGTVVLGAADRHVTETDLPQLEALARRLGCDSISMKTIRPGLVKKMVKQPGWYASEITLRKLLK